MKYNFKRTDTRPKIEYRPTENNRSVSIEGSASCTFKMKDRDDGQLIVNSAGTVESTDPLVLTYTFSEAETAEVGDYNAEFTVTYDSGGERTFPDYDYIPVSIHQEISIDGQVETGDVRPDVTVGTVDAKVIRSEELSTTLYASSISELKDHLDNNVNDWDTNGLIADHIGGTRIILTAGEHVPDAADLPIQPKRNVTIEGQGEGATVVDMSGISKPFIERDNSGNQIDGAAYRRLAVKDLEITGDQTAGSVGVRFSAIPYARLERVHAHDLDQGLILEDGCYFADVVNCDARHNAQTGLTLQPGVDGNPPNGTKVRNGEYAKNGANGIYVEEASGVTIDAYEEVNDEYGILAVGVRGISISGGLESNGSTLTDAADIALSPNIGTDVTVDGADISTSFNTESTCIWVGDARGIDISGCRFRSSTAGTTDVFVSSAAQDVEKYANSYVGQIDTTTTNTSYQSFPTGETTVRRPLVAFSDTDNTTPLAFDTGTLDDTYDVITVKGKVAINGSTNPGLLKGRLNDSTDGLYQNKYQDGSQVDDSFIREETRNPGFLNLQWEIAGFDETGADFARPTSIRSMSSNHTAGNPLINTSYNAVAQDGITSIQIETDDPAWAKINIYGEKYRM